MRPATMMLALCLACGVVLVGAPGHAADPGPAEMLLNPGFEELVDGKAAHWDGETAAPAAEPTDVHGGRRGLRLAVKQSGKYFVGQLSQPELIQLEPDTLYIASAWARGSGRFRIQLDEHKAGKYLGGKSANHIDLTPDWSRYQFYYGTPGGLVDRVRMRFCLDGKDAQAFLDDVSLVRVGPSGTEPDLVANGTMESDDDGDGRPDGWSSSRLDATAIGGVETGERGVALGADGSRALSAPCGFPPQSRGPAFAPETWWDWSGQRPPPATWLVAASSPVFAVDPGRTYDISFQTHGEMIRTFHVKLRWMFADAEKAPRNLVFKVRRDGTWPWEEARQRVTAPMARVDSARLEFWCRAGGGRLCLDNVAVRPSGLAEGWTVVTHEIVPLGEPGTTPPVAAAPSRPALTYTPPVAAATRASVQADALEIRLSNGILLRLRKDGDRLHGLGAVRLGTLPLRNPEAPPIAPLVDSVSGGHYEACVYVDHSVADTGTVTVRSRLRAPGGREDALDWIFAPVERTVAERPYQGFSYRYRLRTEAEEINQVVDRATWELGGDPQGVTVVTQDGYAVDNEFTIAPGNTECPHQGTRFSHGDGFDYQYGPEGGLVVFYDERIPFVIGTRQASPNWIATHDAVQVAGRASVETPRKCVLFSPNGSHDEWTRLRDHVYGHHAELWGIRQHTPMPIANCWMHWKDLYAEGDQVLRNVADRDVPELAKLGFRVVVVHGIWGRGACSPDVLEVGSAFGGPDALKYLCRKAAEHDMVVQAWSSTAHLWLHSPLFKENPDWVMTGANGTPVNSGYHDLLATRFAKGWAEYALKEYGRIHRETGLASLWLDSYYGFTVGSNCRDRRVTLEQAEEVFKYHGKLSQLGYTLYVEGTGSFGIPSNGAPIGNADSAIPALPPPHTRYGLSNYVGDDEASTRLLVKGDYYYRLLANKAPIMLYWRRLKEIRDAHPRIASANRDYNAVVAKMARRHTLPDDRGAEWTNPEDSTRILFSYREGEYSRPGMHSVVDVTTDTPVTLEGEGRRTAFRALPYHTYRITCRGQL